MDILRQKAKQASQSFLENDMQYRLGFVEAEASNPKTKHLGETFTRSTEEGIQMLLSVDRDLIPLFEAALFSDRFDRFYKDITEAIRDGGRVFISGCGATGRLAIRLEASFREAIAVAGKQSPDMLRYIDSVHEIMTGGDYAIIRSVESFEDYTALGMAQARDAGVRTGDILIGVTATGETTSILGAAKAALEDGARVWMIVCTDPATIVGRLKRADDVYTHENADSIYMHCGGMAVTGSTRMQSSSIEQAVIGAALELALATLSDEGPCLQERKRALVRGFEECLTLLSAERAITAMADQIDKEHALYTQGGRVTYFAQEYLLDVLSDTTERCPTFSTPPFRPKSKKGEPPSWAFVKNPMLNTEDAWKAAFLRTPRCIQKTAEEYAAIGILPEDIGKIPDVSLSALYDFPIGCEEDPEREGAQNLASFVAFDTEPTEDFFAQAKKYGAYSVLSLTDGGARANATRMKLFEHLGMKIALNTVSTGTMAKMGRVRGNYMVHLSISNKKLVDRATRIISDLCGVDYETANYELFYTKYLLESEENNNSTTIETIRRLGQKN
jgi:N-acetylmuramic acid 6-phosphate etherase